MTKFSTIIWTATSDCLPPSTWAKRILVALEALREHAGIDRFWTVGREPDEVALSVPALEQLIVRHQATDDDGRPWPEMGSTFALLCTDPGVDPMRPRFRVRFTVGSAVEEPLKNSFVVNFDPATSADTARAVLEACVPAWDACWGCVWSSANGAERRDEFEQVVPADEQRLPLPIDSMLHWVTYFGAERAARISPSAVESTSDVTVRPFREGVEVVLGERWESDAVLRSRQRTIEPLLLGLRSAP